MDLPKWKQTLRFKGIKLEFLWDEERLKALHKRFLILIFLAGVFPGIIYPFLSGTSGFFQFLALTGPILLGIICWIGLKNIQKPNQGIRFLVSIILTQLAAVIYMAGTGNFQSVINFVPFAILLETQFELGSIAALILSGFSLLAFLGLFLWSLYIIADPNALEKAFFFIAAYVIMMIFTHNLGKEVSFQLEAKKKLEQVDDLKNQFVMLSSHYLRTPLTVINSLLNELSLRLTGAEDQQSIDKIKANVSRLNNLTEKLLTISEIEKGKAKIVKLMGDITQVITQAMTKYYSVAKEQQIDLVFIPAGVEIERFAFDRIKIENVLLALLDNAIKYNKAGGSVKVILQNGPGQVRVDVSDTGVGISKQHLDTLFSTFNRGTIENTLTMEKPGMGLSLYLTKLIVEAHGGEIFVTSNEGQGSNFTVILPKG
jgi:signal transduction histidine kinase